MQTLKKTTIRSQELERINNLIVAGSREIPYKQEFINVEIKNDRFIYIFLGSETRSLKEALNWIDELSKND